MTRFLQRNRGAVVLVCTAVVLLALGIWRGEPEVVFRKAVTICMECIGLG